MSPRPRRSGTESRSPVLRFVARVSASFREEIWQLELDRLPFHRRQLVRIARLGYLCARGFLEDRSGMRAMALTYITVLAMIPVLAFCFAVAKAVGATTTLRERVINGFLDNHLDSSGPDAPPSIVELRTTIDGVLDHAEALDLRGVTTVAIVVLLWTVLKTLGAIERSFNEIWGVRRSRTFVRKVSDYLSITIVTPILLVVSVTLTTAAHDNSVVARLRDVSWIGTSIDQVFRFLPLASVWLGFTFLYFLVPNTKTRFTSSVLGGVVAGTLWQLAQVGHVRFQLFLANYEPLYAGFAALPIFLVWLQVSWMVVMVGAQLAHAHQNSLSYQRIARTRDADHAFHELVAMRAAVRIARAFLRGEEPWTSGMLAEDLELPEPNVEQALEPLVEAGILVPTGESSEAGFVFAADPGVVRVEHVLGAIRGERPSEILGATPADEQLAHLLGQLEDEAALSSSNRSLRELAESFEDAGAEPVGDPQPGFSAG